MRAEINKLLSKYIRVENLYYKQNIEEDLLQEADLLYDSIVHEHRFSLDLLREKDLEGILIKQGVVSRDYSLELTRLNNSVRLEQIKLFHNFDNLGLRDQNRAQLVYLRKKISEIEGPLQSLRHVTLEGYADFCRFNFIISNSLYSARKKRVRVEADLLFRIIRQLGRFFSSPRQIAKHPEWRVLWGTEKVRIFRFRPLNNIQRAIIQFSQMYDSVYRSSEKPSEQIIADDDALDGWFHNQSNKNKQGNPVSSRVGRHKNVMVITHSQDKANEIYLSNDKEALKSLGVVGNVQR